VGITPAVMGGVQPTFVVRGAKGPANNVGAIINITTGPGGDGLSSPGGNLYLNTGAGGSGFGDGPYGNIVMVPNGGKVGIGTASPDVQLHLKTSPNTIIKMDGDATGNPYIEWAQAGTAKANIQYIDSGDTLRASVNGNVGWYIDTSGRVGIGEVSPGAKLHVRYPGASTPTGPSGTWAARVDMNQDTTAYNGLSVATRYGAQSSIVFQAASYWSGGGEVYTPILTVTGDQRVGIGDTTPTGKLQVAGDEVRIGKLLAHAGLILQALLIMQLLMGICMLRMCWKLMAGLMLLAVMALGLPEPLAECLKVLREICLLVLAALLMMVMEMTVLKFVLIMV